MTRRHAAWLLLVLAIAGCGGGEPVAPTPPPVQEYESARRAARLAFERGRFDEAAQLYERVRTLAYRRDDLAAIVDAGYNGAVSMAQVSRNDEAAQLVAMVRDDVQRGGLALPPELELLDATVRYRRGEAEQAAQLANQLAGTSNLGVALRARFLAGVIAAESGDQAAIESAITALAGSTEPRIVADADELRGRLAALRGEHAAALAAFQRSADLRTQRNALHAMTRALGLAAGAAQAAGDAMLAGDLYLRAGRSAAARQDLPHARRLLGEATAAGNPAAASAAQLQLDELPSREEQVR